jgi:hypothetical protein
VVPITKTRFVSFFMLTFQGILTDKQNLGFKFKKKSRQTAIRNYQHQ